MNIRANELLSTRYVYSNGVLVPPWLRGIDFALTEVPCVQAPSVAWTM